MIKRIHPVKAGLSDEDRDLFRNAVQDVQPLQPIPQRTPSLQKRGRSACPSEGWDARRADERLLAETFAADVRLRLECSKGSSARFALSSYLQESVEAETILNFHRPGLAKKRLQTLKNGQHTIEGVLDLHGLKPDEAEAALCAFMVKQSELQHRHVLIIHGKGGRLGEAPVIKNLVNRWLPQFPSILAFHSALARQGGAGAVYVLLKVSVYDKK